MTLSVKITTCMITDNLDADAALDRVWMFLTKFSQPLKLTNE